MLAYSAKIHTHNIDICQELPKLPKSRTFSLIVPEGKHNTNEPKWLWVVAPRHPWLTPEVLIKIVHKTRYILQ